MLGPDPESAEGPMRETAIRVLRVWGDALEASTRPLESFSVLPIVLAVACAACGGAPRASGSPGVGSMIVLGFDGLDYDLTTRMIAQGRLPNFARLARTGGLTPLATSVPPQSPVAWSSFIAGSDAGDHGIFDFMHRNPATLTPYLSTTRTEPPGPTIPIGRYQWPLRSGRVTLLREGRAFWEALEERGVPSTIVRMPANFPPSGSAHAELSGMGTPDLLGTYGTFAFYTSNPRAVPGPVPGGTIHRVAPVDGVVQASLTGPDDPFRRSRERSSVPFDLHVDTHTELVRLSMGDEERVLKAGEWTDWVPVSFPLSLMQHLRGMCRFYLKQVVPHLELYVTPTNIDPLTPALPISSPASFATDLAHATGRFYTQGMPEDTKGLAAGVLNVDEFLQQARFSAGEVRKQYRHLLARFQGGFLFYYVGHVDQVSHVMWRVMDPEHPAYARERDEPYRGVIEELYADLDRMVGETLEAMPRGATLVVMSDHGFASWRRSFHLNSWLEQNGYLARTRRTDWSGTLLADVDWTRTRAYGLGLNALYVNLKGREHYGVVPEDARPSLVKELASRLLAVVDPKTGQRAITKVYEREVLWSRARRPERAPDLVIGYAKGTRVSNQSAIGEIPAEVFADNLDAWSGDHCMDHEAVPGVLLSSRPLRRRASTLRELAGSLLAEYGIEWN